MGNNKKTKTRNEILKEKREKEKERYKKIKIDPAKWAEKQRKEHLKYLNKKEKKQVKSISELTPRAERLQRKSWRKTSLKYRQNLKAKAAAQKFVQDNSPPSSDAENNVAPETNSQDTLKRLQQKYRKRLSRLNLTKNEEIKILKKTVERYRLRLKRERKNKLSKAELSPNSIVSTTMQNIGPHEPEIKKQLLFGEAMRQQLCQKYRKIKSIKHKYFFSNLVSGRIIKKYRLQHYCKGFLKNKGNLQNFDPSQLIYNRKNKSDNETKQLIINFLELDINTRLCPGKRDFVKKGTTKKQKRFLNYSMKNLHTKFVAENPNRNVSYSQFCKCRPFWIKQMRIHDRETCKCITHANFEFIVTSLLQQKVISEKSTDEIINSVCCKKDPKCLLRFCQICKNRKIVYNEYAKTEMISYSKWGTTRDQYFDKKNNKNKSLVKTEKKSIVCEIQEVLKEFEKKLPLFLIHEGNNLHQNIEVRKLKSRLRRNEALIHMDFSQNYSLKYFQEIQSFHFGASRRQITLHTVALYIKNKDDELVVKCFCTLSESLLHNVSAIWAHLKPIFKYIESQNSITNLIFLSDGPSTQYRNKTMFYFLANKLEHYYPMMKHFSWNYSEAGHGKGAPDGIGGTCKRTADRLVAQGFDICSFEIFLKKLKENCSGIKIDLITSYDIDEVQRDLDGGEFLPFTGTLKVHQISGKKDLKLLKMRSLSCFDCYECDHFALGFIDYNKRPTDHSLCSSDSSLEISLTTETLKSLNYFNVYSSSNDEENTSNGKIELLLKQDDLKKGSFVLVEFTNLNGKKKFRYVAICDNIEENDMKIISLRKTKNNLFKLDEKDVSYVSVNQILKVLPNPTIVMNGKRLHYKFPCIIDVLEY